MWGRGRADTDAAGGQDAEKTPEASTMLHEAAAGCRFQGGGGLPCTVAGPSLSLNYNVSPGNDVQLDFQKWDSQEEWSLKLSF